MPQYDFSQLSAYDFETLIAGLLQKEWGIRLESFKSGRDQGIDLRYTCIETIRTRLQALFTSNETARTTIIQCKHYIQSGFQKLAAHLRKEEAAKVRKLAPERYVLVTSVGLTPTNKEEIKAIFSPYIGGPRTSSARLRSINFLNDIQTLNSTISSYGLPVRRS